MSKPLEATFNAPMAVDQKPVPQRKHCNTLREVSQRNQRIIRYLLHLFANKRLNELIVEPQDVRFQFVTKVCVRGGSL